MHPAQYDFVSSLKSKYLNKFQNSKILEIGSLDVNGSIRPIFENCDFTGIDIGPGLGVDIVCEGQKFSGEDNYYDVVISCECFEHNPFWLETFFNMWRMCKHDGLVIFTCATTGREPHGLSLHTPAASPLTVEKGWNYYRNLTPDDFSTPLNLNYFFKKYDFSILGTDLRFYGLKS